MPLQRLRQPFDHPEWVFEVKHDGFRALACIEISAARLVSRHGNTFKSFSGLCASLAAEVKARDCVLDGEICCIGPDGRSLFDPLLYRRSDPCFYSFDILWLNGRDLRSLPLVERKRILRRIVPPQPARLLYVDHITERGIDLFRAACANDLEGIVGKLATAPYGTEPSSWIKVKNPTYSQAVGRWERFEQMRARKAASK
jgi:bifunctional non-homologous end joining protein LigD